MFITKQELKDLNACSAGFARFIKQTNGTDEPVEVKSLIGGENTYSDLLWLAGKKLPKEKIAKFACDCALINIKFIRPYTNEYNLIIDFLNNPFESNAVYAVYAAVRAVRAVDAAVYAAARTAAARTAAYAVYAAVRAVRAVDAARTAAARTVRAADAAVDAASNAVYSKTKEKIDKLLIELFND